MFIPKTYDLNNVYFLLAKLVLILALLLLLYNVLGPLVLMSSAHEILQLKVMFWYRDYPH